MVARSVGSSRRAAVVGMTWPVPAELDRKALERKRFAPSRCKRHGAADHRDDAANPCSGMRSCWAKRNSSAQLRALTIAITRGPSSGTLPRSRSSSIASSRARAPSVRNRGAGFFWTGRKLARLRSECQGLHRAEPGVYSAAAAHEPIFPPGAKADAVALAWVVLEGGG